jgi:hypothetical protein
LPVLLRQSEEFCDFQPLQVDAGPLGQTNPAGPSFPFVAAFACRAPFLIAEKIFPHVEQPASIFTGASIGHGTSFRIHYSTSDPTVCVATYSILIGIHYYTG